MTIFKTLFKTLNKNASSFTITDEAISNNSIFEVYPSDESVILADVTVNGTTANITFDSAAEYNIPCAVFINNLVGAYEPITHVDASDVNYMLNISVKDALDNNMSALVNQGSRIYNLENKDSVIDAELDSLDGRVTALEDAPPPSTYVELTKEEYDALPESKLTDGVQYFIKDWSEEAGAYNISTKEIETGRKFFDKKTYIRAYNFTSNISTQGTNVGTSTIPNLNDMASIVNAVMIKKDGRAWSPLAVYMSSGNLSIRTQYNTTGASDIYIVLEYTKVGE